MKKQISNGVPLPEKFLKPYKPEDSEDKIYKLWEESGFFNPDVCVDKGVIKKDAKPYSIVLPPPNVTGILHMGHAAMLAVEDILIRYNRMRGKKTLWLPGTDHAAIATQARVEGIIYKKEKKTRHDLGQEEFLKRIDQFAKESRDTIVNQIKKMGSSVDWSREAFTLDEKRSLAVRTAFKRMYDDGLIYRGARIVNWDPKMQTTVSDDEVVRKEEKANFYYLKYGPFEIGTARPETKFGDKYVVMHPKDNRYKKYKHGQTIDLEWINGPITATIVKDEAIDMEFGGTFPSRIQPFYPGSYASIPVEEIFTGSNFKSYRHRYYLGCMKSDVRPTTDFQQSEVSDRQWMTLDECLQRIRPYNLEKRQLITDIDKILHRYRLIS